jgi:nucleotidyltransferase/DNA polymerase involved in DNA repair
LPGAGRVPRVGKVTEEKLGKLGIKTVAELLRLVVSTLEDEFGRYGVRLYDCPAVLTKDQWFRTGPRNQSLSRTHSSMTCLWQKPNP